MPRNMTKVVLKRNGNYDLTIWEISAFLSRFNTYHYRTLLLNAIEQELSDGTKADDIFILDASFKIENIYEKIGSISMNTKEIMELLYIGKPVALMPSLENKKLQQCFSFVERIREEATEYGFDKWMSAEVLTTIIEETNKTNISVGIDAGIKLIADKTVESKNERLLEKIKDIKQEILENFREYIINKETITKIRSELIENPKACLGNEYIEKEFDEFSRVFNKVVRPFVFVYDREKEKIKILIEGQVNKKLQDDSFVRLENYKKVNPDFFTILMSGTFNAVLDKIVNKEKNDLEKELLKEQIKESQENQKTQIMIQNGIAQELEKRKNQIQYTSDFNQSRANNAYLTSQITHLRDNVYDKSNALVEQYDIKVENIVFDEEV